MFKSFFERIHLKRIFLNHLKMIQMGSLKEFLLILDKTECE